MSIGSQSLKGMDWNNQEISKHFQSNEFCMWLIFLSRKMPIYGDFLGAHQHTFYIFKLNVIDYCSSYNQSVVRWCWIWHRQSSQFSGGILCNWMLPSTSNEVLYCTATSVNFKWYLQKGETHWFWWSHFSASAIRRLPCVVFNQNCGMLC